MKTLNELLIYELRKKSFRVRENIRKMQYIKENTFIIDSVLFLAAVYSNRNSFHNFGHQLGVAESFIKLALVMGLSKKEITEVVIALLFHDALHKGIQGVDDEVNSFEVLSKTIDETDYAFMGLVKNKALMTRSRDVILATIFNDRGKTRDEILRMVQDSDIGHIGQGPTYWMWASMGLVDEFIKDNLTTDAISFIKSGQRFFVNQLCKASGTGKPFLSEAANKAFIDPLESLAKVEAFSPSQIMFAYNNKQNDLTVAEFERGLLKAA